MARHSYESIQSEIARLQGLAKRLEKQREKTKTRARRKVFALMKKLGITVSDLMGAASRGISGGNGKTLKKLLTKKAAKSRKRRAKVPVKYKGPKAGQRWTGRGRTPRWMAAFLAEGKKKEDFLIKS